MTRVLMAHTTTLAAASPHARTLTGMVVPYDQPGATSAGVLSVAPGAIRLPSDLRAVKLLRDHDRTRPVGYAISASDRPDGLAMTFRVARTADGDQALLEATEGVRDAFSVELDGLSLDGTTVTGADLSAVAQVPIPAYTAARIAQVAAARTHRTDPDDDPDDDDQGPDDQQPETDTDPQQDPPQDPDHLEATMSTIAALDAAAYQIAGEVDLTPAAGAGADAPDPQTTAAATRPHPAVSATATRPRGVQSVADAAALIAARARGAITSAQLEAALSDVTTAPGSAGAVLQPQWVGNLWTADPSPRPHVDAISGPVQLTGLTVTGFVWNPPMTVDKWAGDKAPIPTSAPKATAGSVNAQRWAGGVDVAREFLDLGSASVIADLLAMARDDYRVKTDLDCLAKLQAAATPLTATSATEALTKTFQQFQVAKVAPTYIGIGSAIWAALADQSAVGALVQSSLSLTGGTFAGATFTLDLDLGPDTVLGLAKRAATFYETGPLTVEALNVAQGGVDEAVHGYTATLINRPAAVVLTTATLAAGGTQSAAKSK